MHVLSSCLIGVPDNFIKINRKCDLTIKLISLYDPLKDQWPQWNRFAEHVIDTFDIDLLLDNNFKFLNRVLALRIVDLKLEGQACWSFGN